MNEHLPTEAEGESPVASPLALIVCLLVLACTAAAGSMAGGILRMATAQAGENPWTVVLQGLGIILGGWVVGAVLWAAAWLVGWQHEIALEQRKLAQVIQTAAIFAPPPPPHPITIPPPQVAAGMVGAADGQAAQQLLGQLAELNANLLLTDEQRQAKRREQAARAVNELVARIERSIEAGELTQADEALGSLALQYPSDERPPALRERLVREWALRIVRAIEAGDLAAAQTRLDRLASRMPSHPRLAELEQRLARAYVSGVERAIQSNDLAGANQKLQRFRDRFAGRAEAAPLQEQIDRAGSAVLAQEIAAQRRRIQELIAMAAFDKAEAAASELAQRHPESAEARALLDLVRRDAMAFRTDRGHRIYMEIEKHVDARQWRQAVAAAHKLLEGYPAAPEVDMLKAQMPTLEENARIEEVRELRDLIRTHIKAKRYTDALRVAQDVVRRFPSTQAASELGGQIVRLRELAFSNAGGE